MGRAGALSAACFLSSAAVPAIGTVAMLFSPAPVLIFAVGRPDPNRRAFAAALIATGLVAVLWSPLVSLNYLFSFGLPTVLIGFMVERRRPFEAIVAVGACAMFIAMVCAGLIAEGGTAGVVRTIYHDLTQEPFFLGWLLHLKTGGPQFYKFLRLEPAISPQTQALIVRLVVRLSPALVLLAAALSVLLSLRVFWQWAGSRRLSYNLFGDLQRWSAPEWTIWPLLAAGFAWQFVPVPAVKDVALNSLVILAAVYFCQGLAIIAYYFQAMKSPRIVRGLIYLIVFAQPELAVIVCVAGIFDLWIDFRRINSAGPPAHKLERLP